MLVLPSSQVQAPVEACSRLGTTLEVSILFISKACSRPSGCHSAARSRVGATRSKPRPLVARILFSSSSFEPNRSEEHTSELQSLMRISYAVFCLKKNKEDININIHKTHIRMKQKTCT